MSLPECHEIVLAQSDGVLTLTLNRPHKRNAMNRELVEEIIAVFDAIDDDRSIRAVVLRGAGGHFCAGADIEGMNTYAANETAAEQITWEFNRMFGRLVSRVNRAPQVVIALLEGAVLGGGFGLVCISDVAIALHDARFGMPETGLGLVPAQIAPFVVARIGLTQARRLALLGERINGEQAVALGLVHFTVADETALQQCLEDVLAKVRRCAPTANALTKQLMLQVGELELDTLLDRAADCFTEAMCSEEGIEGSRAFIEKRLPRWAQ